MTCMLLLLFFINYVFRTRSLIYCGIAALSAVDVAHFGQTANDVELTYMER